MASVLPTKTYARIPVIFDMPDLIEIQLDSFRRLKSEGLGDLLNEISPIESYNKGMKLFFPSRTPESQQWGLKYWFGEPKHSIDECVERDLTYASPISSSLSPSSAPGSPTFERPVRNTLWPVMKDDRPAVQDCSA